MPKTSNGTLINVIAWNEAQAKSKRPDITDADRERFAGNILACFARMDLEPTNG